MSDALDEFESLVARCDRLMRARVEYTRTDGDHKLRGSIEAFFEADDVESWEPNVARFERGAKKVLAERGWAFEVLERVDWYVSNEGAARSLALAIEALETEQVALGVGYEYADEPETIDPEETEALEAAIATQRLCYVKTEDLEIPGFIVSFSDDVVLLHHLDLDVLTLNGYRAFPRAELLRLVSLEEESELEEGQVHFAHAVLQELDLMPTNPGAPVDDVATFLRWAGGIGLVGVYEREAPYGRFVGKVASVDDEVLVLHGISRTGSRAGEFEHPLAQIVRVDVLDGYLLALERATGRAS